MHVKCAYKLLYAQFIQYFVLVNELFTLGVQ